MKARQGGGHPKKQMNVDGPTATHPQYFCTCEARPSRTNDIYHCLGTLEHVHWHELEVPMGYRSPVLRCWGNAASGHWGCLPLVCRK